MTVRTCSKIANFKLQTEVLLVTGQKWSEVHLEDFKRDKSQTIVTATTESSLCWNGDGQWALQDALTRKSTKTYPNNVLDFQFCSLNFLLFVIFL